LRLAPELIANFVAPYLVYQLLEARYGDVTALIASALPPLIWSGYELIKTRRLDAISVLVVAGILFTLVATAMGGSARLIQIRDALVTGVIGVMFLGSLLLKKPMIFYLARATMARNTEEGAKEFETLWSRPGARATFRLMTGVWGAGLVLQTALLCWLAWIWPIGRYLLLSPFISYAIFGAMMAWSLWYGTRRKALGQLLDRRRAAQSAPPAEV
jgi:intracellular septation protein A